MKRIAAIVVSLGLVSSALLYVLHGSHPVQHIARTVVAAAKPVATQPSSVPAVPNLVTKPVKKEYQDKLRDPKNYWAMAKQLLPAAKAGDVQAQFLLWQLPQRCHTDRLGTFLQDRHTGTLKSLTLQEALDKAAQWGYDAVEVTAFYNGCHPFDTEEAAQLGKPLDWLQLATDAGYTPAQAMTAHLSLLHQQTHDISTFTGIPVEDSTVSRLNGEPVEPKVLLQAAVRTNSQDPAVLEQIGDNQNLLNPHLSAQERRTNALAWKYLACQHMDGDCGWGEQVMINCAPHDEHCQGVPVRMLEAVKYDWTPVARRVEEIQAAMLNQQWDQLPGL